MKEEPSFLEKDVSWSVDDIEMEGTITYPTKGDSHPGLLFVAGSGPTDRNWCSPLLPGENGSAKILAKELATRGFAAIRFDKRASGPRARENAMRLAGKIDMKSHVDEVAGAMKSLSESGLVDRDKIFALTNSEGVIHALNYQIEGHEPLFKGFVLTGTPGRSVGDVAREQILNQVKNLENSERLMELYDGAIADFSDAREVRVDPSLPESVKFLIAGLTTPANLPFSRELWSMDPSDLLKKVNKPMLIMIGKKDLQINWKLDGKLLEETLKGRDNVTFCYPEDANHVLKHETTPREELVPEKVGLGYNAPGRDLDQEALNAILDWLIGIRGN